MTTQYASLLPNRVHMQTRVDMRQLNQDLTVAKTIRLHCLRKLCAALHIVARTTNAWPTESIYKR